MLTWAKGLFMWKDKVGTISRHKCSKTSHVLNILFNEKSKVRKRMYTTLSLWSPVYMCINMFQWAHNWSKQTYIKLLVAVIPGGWLLTTLHIFVNCLILLHNKYVYHYCILQGILILKKHPWHLCWKKLLHAAFEKQMNQNKYKNEKP